MYSSKLFFIALVFFLKGINGLSQDRSDTLSIFFKRNEYVPSLEQLQDINRLIIKNQSSIDSIRIYGYSSSLGNIMYNLKLSEKRAVKIKEIAARIVESEKIVLKALGEQDGIFSKNRKAHIVVYTSTEKSHSAKVINEKRVLKGLNFFNGKDVFTPKSKVALLELLTYAQENEEVEMRFIGHICCSWNRDPSEDDINIRTKKRNLSEARAKAVYDFLVQNNIEAERLSYVGRAYKEPLGGEDRWDRRVEVEIIEPREK